MSPERRDQLKKIAESGQGATIIEKPELKELLASTTTNGWIEHDPAKGAPSPKHAGIVAYRLRGSRAVDTVSGSNRLSWDEVGDSTIEVYYLVPPPPPKGER